MEAALIEYSMLVYKPSLLAGGAVYLASKLCFSREPWSKQLESCTHLEEPVLRKVAKALNEQVVLKVIKPDAHLKAVFNKFASSKFGSVSQKTQDLHLR